MHVFDHVSLQFHFRDQHRVVEGVENDDRGFRGGYRLHREAAGDPDGTKGTAGTFGFDCECVPRKKGPFRVTVW